jgi:hypothetical protein
VLGGKRGYSRVRELRVHLPDERRIAGSQCQPLQRGERGRVGRGKLEHHQLRIPHGAEIVARATLLEPRELA